MELLVNHFSSKFELIESWKHGASFKINDYLQLFVKWKGLSGNKGYASIDALNSYRRDNDLYLNYEEASTSINFSATKLQDKIIKDIEKRLLDESVINPIYEYVKTQVKNHNEYKNLVDSNKKELLSMGYREYGKEKVDMYKSDICSVEIDLSTLPTIQVRYVKDREKYLKIAKFLSELFNEGE